MGHDEAEGRFRRLEIGGSAEPAPRPAASGNSKKCRGCGSPNELQREVCWACYRPLKTEASLPPPPREPGAEFVVVLDGREYRSGQKDLPPEVAHLLKRLAEEGYSEALAADWKLDPLGELPPRREEVAPGIQILEGRRVNSITINGRTFVSDDPGLDDELKGLFAYLRRNGPTPGLMAALKKYAKGR